MRFPPGVDADKAAIGYVGALQGFTIEAIVHGIRRFLRGEVEDVSAKFCPHPPELARIVRDGMPKQSAFKGLGNVYGYCAPRSRILERKCTKEWARAVVEEGVHPRGSIWCPGPIDDSPEIGDLYAPDPAWKPPFKLGKAA